MITIDRIEKVKQILALNKKIQGEALKIAGVEKAMVQLLNICSNQEAEIALLKQQIESHERQIEERCT